MDVGSAAFEAEDLLRDFVWSAAKFADTAACSRTARIAFCHRIFPLVVPIGCSDGGDSFLNEDDNTEARIAGPTKSVDPRDLVYCGKVGGMPAPDFV